MMKKNICFFLGNLSGVGGTERMTCNLANGLVNLGYNVLIVGVIQNQKPFFKFDDKIITISIFKKQVNAMWLYPMIIYRLGNLINDHKIDILINVDVILALFSLPVKLFKYSLKIISWEHFNYITNLGIKSRTYSRLLSKRYADAIITLTEEDKKYYEEHGTIYAKILAIPNFIADYPSSYSSCNEPIVLAVGRFCYQKAFDNLIDIWKLVKKTPASQGWKLRIVGDGEDKEALSCKVLECGLNESVEILPASNNISYYYLHSSMFVMSSRFEGLPMVLIESKYYGLPIVCLDCVTGPKDLISNGVNGFLIPNRNFQEMADKICCLMENGGLRKQMGQENLRDSSRFASKAIIRRWDSLLCTL